MAIINRLNEKIYHLKDVENKFNELSAISWLYSTIKSGHKPELCSKCLSGQKCKYVSTPNTLSSTQINLKKREVVDSHRMTMRTRKKTM